MLPLQNKLFKSYIEMELQLGNIERCRTLYAKYIEWSPANAGAWGRCAWFAWQRNVSAWL
jgi:crooked neck